MFAGFLALSLLLSQVPVVPLPCVQGDSTVVCHCKQGMASACAALVDGEAEALKGILRAAAMVKAAQEAGKAQEKAADAVDTGCGGGQDPNNDDDGKQKCTGQLHHIISKVVWEALDQHLVLKGLYRHRDPRFVARAKDLKAHCGWQDWHRDLDAEIAKWIRERPNLTPRQFEAYLREVYSRADLLARFPNGF